MNKVVDYHVFVAMPFGEKEGINFNRVYDDYIKPALESVGFDVFRADKEMRAGDIITDMFQELLIADLVVVDVSIDNPNVWYELGIRHALKARGVIQINGSRDYMPFDVYTQRTLPYNLKDGVPDPDKLEEDKNLLAAYAVKTMEAWYGREVSPVYQLLHGLKEPDVASLKTYSKESSDGALSEFWYDHQKWEEVVNSAKNKYRPGDIMVLADEAPNRIFRIEGYKKAGECLQAIGHYEFALEQYNKALEIDPRDIKSLQRKAIVLGRMGKFREAESILNKLEKEYAASAETYGLLGRVEKDKWISSWRGEDKSLDEQKSLAKQNIASLDKAIQKYMDGFICDPSDYYTGINALTLKCLKAYLTGEDLQSSIDKLQGGVRWAVHSCLTNDPEDQWGLATDADFEVLFGTKETVQTKYDKATAYIEKDWFKLDSVRQQLIILKDLGYKNENVLSALEVIDTKISKIKSPYVPRKVILFSGHMIDKPDRKNPRFPPDKEDIALQNIVEKLDQIGASDEDLGLCGGACGGDILFAEECLRRGMKLEIRIQSKEPEFIKESVSFAGEDWRERFNAIKTNKNTTLLVQPDELGAAPAGSDKYERNNNWQLYSALSRGPDKVFFICLWNGAPGDGVGGTQHMKEVIEQRTGNIYVIDTNKLW